MPYILLLILIICFIYSFKWFLLIIMIAVIAFVVYNKSKYGTHEAVKKHLRESRKNDSKKAQEI